MGALGSWLRCRVASVGHVAASTLADRVQFHFYDVVPDKKLKIDALLAGEDARLVLDLYSRFYEDFGLVAKTSP